MRLRETMRRRSPARNDLRNQLFLKILQMILKNWLSQAFSQFVIQFGGVDVPVDHFAFLVDQNHGWER